jgi:putative phosphoesterase
MSRIGLISDTHGLLRPEVEAFLRGSEHIVHAGDICDPAILERLAALAPVTAVRGNNDRGPWAECLPAARLVRFGSVLLYVLHDLSELTIDLAASGVHVVVSGHSHRPRIEQKGSVLFVNPGSPGPRRFRLPIAAAELLIDRGAVSARIAEFPAQGAG